MTPKIGDQVTIKGTVISFLSGGKEARVRLDTGMPLPPNVVISAAPEALTVIEPEDEVVLPDGCVGGHHPDLVSCEIGADWP